MQLNATASHYSSAWQTASARRTYVAGALWVVGTLLAMGADEPALGGWFQIRLDLTGAVLLTAALVGGWNFFPKALRGLRKFRLDMNFLMTVAIVGAILIGEPVEAAAIGALFSFAELLESAAVVRGRRAVEELVRLTPEKATVVGENDVEQQIPTSQLQIGQRVRVRPGETIPVDGRITDGESAIDEATVTGESVPVTKSVADPVYAGTTVAEGYLEIEATAAVGDTTLARIIRLVRHAQTQRAPIEQFVDQFARYYTPAITALAATTMLLPPFLDLGTGLEWFTRGLTLLVIACPCALVIATPVTMVSALTSAARHGVIIKGGQYLEALGATCAMAFDKTGSLTQGRLTVTDVKGLDGVPDARVLELAAAVEARSEHPIARAIVEYGARHMRSDLAVSEFVARAGTGVVAIVSGREIRVGTASLFSAHETSPEQEALEAMGRTVVLVGNQDKVFGLIALADTMRSNAPTVLHRLRQMGVHEQVMLTGDHEMVAHAIARSAGINDVRVRLLPQDKVEAIEELRARHRVVAMIGDGVNDAPALAASDVGIAMGAAGSPATIETADVALIADDLAMLPYAVRMARLARRVVRLNIVAALTLKLLLAAGAIGGIVSLLLAVLVGDLGASILVTMNAMRLARVQPAVIP